VGLTACPDCGNEISDAAYVCPHCGRPTPKHGRELEKNQRRVRFLLLVIVLLLAGYQVWLIRHSR